MYVIRKKQILFMFCCIFFSIFIYVAGDNLKRDINTTQVVALPVSNKVIVVDAGHGVPDEEEKLLKSMDITQQ